jgi:tRNA-2-methylthio-N6-dimethylallyladenosine synthase
MGRGYTRSEYLDLAAQLRRSRPGLALSTDLIVGFPGENEEDFEQTLELLREVRFAATYAFKYSPRPGTAAPRLDGAVPSEVADPRLQRLFALQEGIQREINESLVGEEFEVLVTGWGKQPGTQTGRTPCHRVVHFATGSEPVTLGGTTRVQVESGFPYSLQGRRLSAPSAVPVL